MKADDWFINNWRLLVTDVDIRNAFATDVYNYVINGKDKYSFWNTGDRTGSNRLGQNSFLYTFITNMRKIQDLFDVVGVQRGGFPVSRSFSNWDHFHNDKYLGYTGARFKEKYREILNAYATISLSDSLLGQDWTQNEFEVISSGRMNKIFQTGSDGTEFKMYEILMMESLTRLLVDTFFGGDIGNFNSFNYEVAHLVPDLEHPENDIISPPIYNPDHNNADFQGLNWLSDLLKKDSRIYIGPRVV